MARGECSSLLDFLSQVLVRVQIACEVEVDLGEDGGCWHLCADGHKTEVKEGPSKHPDVILRCAPEALAAVASGDKSPLEAVSSGDLEIAGDLGMIAVLEGALADCCRQ